MPRGFEGRNLVNSASHALQVVTAATTNNNSRGSKRSKKSPVPNAQGASDPRVTKLQGYKTRVKTISAAITTRKWQL